MKAIPIRPSALLAVLLLSLLSYSCQQGPDDNPPPVDPPGPPPEHVDSSLLIKSVRVIYYDDDGTPEDSVTENFSYDTAARKITSTFNTTADGYRLGGTHEYIYNSSNLLSQINFKYLPAYPPDAGDLSAVYISYDNTGILTSIGTRFIDGSTKGKTYTKAMLADGRYEVSWSDTIPNNYWAVYKNRYDAAGQWQAYETDFFQGLGTQMYSQNIDTFAYDEDGSITSETIYNRLISSNDVKTALYAQTLSRQKKGDQLYNQRRLVLNGVTDFLIFDDNDKLFDAFTAFGGVNVDASQYCKYPAVAMKEKLMNPMAPGSPQDPIYETVLLPAVFDSKDRLVSLRGFFHDAIIIRQDYKIEYYK